MASNYNYDANKKPSVGLGTGFGILIGAVFLFLFAAWMIFHDHIAMAMLKYAYYINFPIAWVTQKIGIQYFTQTQYLIVEAAKSAHAITLGQILSIINRASISYVVFTPLIIYFIYRSHDYIIFRLECLHGYKELMRLQALTNPCIVPSYRFNEYWEINKIDRHKNINRALMPDEFAQKYDLITIDGDRALLNVQKANKVFADQLGRKLDVSSMPKHAKALAVIFMTRIIYRGEVGRTKAKKMLDAINNSCDPEKTSKTSDADCYDAFDFSVADQFMELFSKREIQRISTFFTYEYTFLMELLQQARVDGKLPPAHFLWLKLIDRPMFYALYGVSIDPIAKGYPEGAAAFTQYWSSVTQMKEGFILTEPIFSRSNTAAAGLEKRLFEANMVSERKLMTDREIEREREFGRIPEV